MNLKSKYYSFHGRKPRKKEGINVHYPEGLVLLGKAIAIEYECDKLHGGGDGKKAVYRHVFENPAKVCMDEKGKNQIYIIGNKIRVTDAGIEG